MIQHCMATPVGTLTLQACDTGLTAIHWGEIAGEFEDDSPAARQILEQAERELMGYFSGQLTHFETPLAATGTSFQTQVWQALLAIPYGETQSYGELAKRIGRSGAARAVGAAAGKNPLPIIVPCHRLIGSNGQLTGFASGLVNKRTLLALEQSAGLFRR
jgi:methylated-DNA-[protein]-cysteine S-methyltransferase